ncbi:MAG: hypothetical protein GKC10_03360 [Methanosarcinales archaeon]|nr:hypothetical protein [Methanosarcinales archaeon]
MSLSNLPTSFGPSFFIRTFMPGFMASTLYSYALMPAFRPEWLGQTSIENKLLTWIVFAVVFGMTLSALDVQIYQLYEGLRFWPPRIWRWKHQRTLRHFKGYEDDLLRLKQGIEELSSKEGQDENELCQMVCRQSHLSSRIREFPYNPDEAGYSRRYPQEATRFGNVLCEYEQYPEVQYGMHMMVFWHHLWLILPKEAREDLDLRGAEVDSLVYLSFIFFSYALIGGAGFHHQNILTVTFLGRELVLGGVLSALLSIFLGWLFYQVSISSLKSYGRYVKSAFDLYRFDLASRMGIKTSGRLVADEAEIESWRTLRRYLLDYRRPPPAKGQP